MMNAEGSLPVQPPRPLKSAGKVIFSKRPSAITNEIWTFHHSRGGTASYGDPIIKDNYHTFVHKDGPSKDGKAPEIDQMTLG